MDVNGGGKKMLAGNLANSPNNITWADDSSGLYFLLGEKGSQNLKFSSLSGGVRNVTEGRSLPVRDFHCQERPGGYSGLVFLQAGRPRHLQSQPPVRYEDAGRRQCRRAGECQTG